MYQTQIVIHGKNFHPCSNMPRGITICLIVSHLYGRKWWKGEELGHPQLKVETKAVEKGPDINQFTWAQPQGGDGKSADGCKKFFEDLIVISTNVVVNIPARDTTMSQNPLVYTAFGSLCP